jgi:DNA-binding CsgD family transcriptional regulator
LTTAVVEGEPGLGKSTLLDVGGSALEEAGFVVLATRCSELERNHQGEVVSQLLRQAVLELGRLGLEVRAEGDVSGLRVSDLSAASMQLAERRPVAVVVDDLQWCDRESSQALSYLARRTVPGQVLLVAATLPHQSSVEIGAADGIISEPSTRVFRLSELSLEAVRSVVADRLGELVAPELVTAYHERTLGNPFLLDALLTDAGRAGGEHPWLVDPRELAPPSVARSIRVRLASAPAAAPAVLQAVSVLGEGAELAAIASLAEIDLAEASTAADALADAWILRRQRPLCFAYPLERATVYREMPPARRARVHGGAARLLAERGAPFDTVARHLVRTEPAGDPWIADELDRAARLFVGAKRFGWARRCLDRALMEPLASSDRARLLTALAAAEAAEGLPSTLVHLREAADLGADPSTLAEPALLLAEVVDDDTTRAELVALLKAIAGRLDERADRPRELRLRLEVAAAIDLSPDGASVSAATIESLLHGSQTGGTNLERRALAHLSAIYAHHPQRRSADAVADLAERLLDEDPLRVDDLVDVAIRTRALVALVRAGRFEAADAAARQAKATAQEAQRPGVVVEFSNVLAYSMLLQGSLDVAEAECRHSLVLGAEGGGVSPRSECLRQARAILAGVYLARGRSELAADLLDAETGPRSFSSLLLLEQRAFWFVATDRPADALGVADRAADLARQWGIENPAATSWRAASVLAQLQIGSPGPARQLAAENVRLARVFGASWSLGQALRVAAAAAPASEQVDLLTEAVSVLERSGAELELARALVELGTVLRQRGAATEARAALRRGADLALRCGATPLVDRARLELRATGARPRRLALSGAGSLTPMERRVADMAVAGHLNSHIAKVLFISNKTVEGHLSRVYRKLGIQSRHDLATAMAPAAALDRAGMGDASTG